MKERRRAHQPRRPRQRISTHAPVKERRGVPPAGGVQVIISTHAPVKERPRAASSTALTTHFNSRSCEGATNPHEYGVLRDWISTHAPVKERPPPAGGTPRERKISTHAPVKERQGGLRQGQSDLRNFNSRSCEGATPAYPHRLRRSEISTHAPVKERPQSTTKGRRR